MIGWCSSSIHSGMIGQCVACVTIVEAFEEKQPCPQHALYWPQEDQNIPASNVQKHRVNGVDEGLAVPIRRSG